ncbi:hypothetical protein HSIEG1_318 [Enterococcus sp. HSIEG1]|nr:hypothetical protein HSIEG1_318 [Enterococcus sp. HSIEG1]
MTNDLQRGIVATLHITSKDTISLSDVEKQLGSFVLIFRKSF